MENRTRRDGFIIGALLIIIALMTIGYATLAVQFTSNQNNDLGSGKWNIEISSITINKMLSSHEASEVAEPIVAGTSATFNVNLVKPGEKIVYDIIIKNSGDFEATFKQMSGVNELNMAYPQNIAFKVERLDDNDNITTGESDLVAGTTHKFRVTIESDKDSNNTTSTYKTGTIYFDYQQK